MMQMMQMMMNCMWQGQGKGWGKGGGKGWGESSGEWRTSKVDGSGGELGEFTGTIKSFSDKNWYGFIECPEVAAQGKGDVFLNGDEKRGYRIGHKVKFTCVLNKDGKPQAKCLKSGLKE